MLFGIKVVNFGKRLLENSLLVARDSVRERRFVHIGVSGGKSEELSGLCLEAIKAI